MRNYTVIGITGPTGAGKSTVTNYFNKKGCYVIDADMLGRKSLEKGSFCLKQVCFAFGSDVLNADGTLNRQTLARKAFSTAENTELLNSITHPWICMQVLKTIDNIRNNTENPIIIFDAAVLLESSMDILCDYIVAVTAPIDVRKKRIMKRDHLTEESADLRINAQKQEEFYLKQADFVINGEKQIDEIYSSADNILVQINRR